MWRHFQFVVQESVGQGEFVVLGGGRGIVCRQPCLGAHFYHEGQSAHMWMQDEWGQYNHEGQQAYLWRLASKCAQCNNETSSNPLRATSYDHEGQSAHLWKRGDMWRHVQSVLYDRSRQSGLNVLNCGNGIARRQSCLGVFLTTMGNQLTCG